MSKGLKALGEISGYTEVATLAGYVEQPIKKVYKEEFTIIKKELKALEIIKNKGIDILILKAHKKAKTYNEHAKFAYCKSYTDEEFDLIKEVME